MAAPKNVEYYVSRINGYSKNTVRLQPVSVKAFVSGDVIIFRLPTNAIIDLHTLAITWDLCVPNNTAAAAPILLPRYTQSFVRRIDVTAGGVQVGLGSLNDYGGLWSLLAVNGISAAKHGELAVLDGGSGTSFATQTNGYGTSTAGTALAWEAAGLFGVSLPASVTTNYWRQSITGFLGVLGGQYMRFLDTNLLPDVEVRITLASSAVICGTGTTAAASVAGYTVNSPLAQFETISFGDSSYESMVEARLSTGEPIVVPFINHASFETMVTGSTGQCQFTVASQSVNTVIASVRTNGYDSFQTGIVGATSVQVPFYSFDGQAAAVGTGLPTQYGQAIPAVLGSAGIAPTRYQLTIDSKMYPQFMADVADAYQITKNAYDGSGNNKLYCGLFRDLYAWSHAGFALAIALDHNSEDSLKDRLVSGLNTNGSNIPITFQISGTTSAAYKPIVFVELTSTLMIYPGRVISVIN